MVYRSTMDPGACEMERLPEELLAHVISLACTSPAVACCVAAVSPAFRASADSDCVWSRFLPRDLPLLAMKELPLTPLSSKGLFLRLADQPALLRHKFIRMQLDKATGTKCFALCARALQFPGLVSRAWGWIHLRFDHNTRGKNFLEAAAFPYISHFEVRGKIHRKMLSQNSTYAAYMVFKIKSYEFNTWDIQLDEASVTIGEDVVVSRRRADGWMELQLGEFYNGEDDAHGEVSMSLRDLGGGTYKERLIVRSIEIRTKHQS